MSDFEEDLVRAGSVVTIQFAPAGDNLWLIPYLHDCLLCDAPISEPEGAILVMAIPRHPGAEKNGLAAIVCPDCARLPDLLPRISGALIEAYRAQPALPQTETARSVGERGERKLDA